MGVDLLVGRGSNDRYVFYVDDNNLLRGVYFESNKWHLGNLLDQNCTCAPYSKLAAIRLVNPAGYNFVTVYYQTTGVNGDIKEVSLNSGAWAKGQPDPDDPPLYGTSLSAVSVEPGIESTSSSTSDTDKGRLPAMFFQYNTLGLGSSQDTIGNLTLIPSYTVGTNNYPGNYFAAYSKWPINDNSKLLSNHAALTAVDDGTNLWAFYTSDDIYATALSKSLTADADAWSASGCVLLTR